MSDTPVWIFDEGVPDGPVLVTPRRPGHPQGPGLIIDLDQRMVDGRTAPAESHDVDLSLDDARALADAIADQVAEALRVRGESDE